MSDKLVRIERRESRGFLKEALLLIPNFLKLLMRLFTDSRVPLAEKAFLAGAIVYVVSPLDLIPDVIPFIGQVDDIYLVALTLTRLLMRAPEDVVREHWEGSSDIVTLIGRIESTARYVLPKRIQRILLGRVEIGSKYKSGGVVASPAAPADIESHFEQKRDNTRAS